MSRKVRRAAAITVGMVLLLAGVLKLVDPVGAMLSVNEYFNFFHLGFLKFASKFIAVALAFFEAVTGAALLSGVHRKEFGVITCLLILFFTIVTAALLVWNPDMDCACFGRFIRLTHLQSFIKNLVLLALCGVAYLPFSVRLGDPKRIKYVGFTLALVSLVVFTIFSLAGLPLVDRTQFSPGSELFDPEHDSSDNPPVLSFYDREGEYRDELALKGPVAIVSVYDPDAVDWDGVLSCLDMAAGAGCTALALSSYSPDVPDDPRVFFADRRLLMSVNRSNGGLSYIHDGLIIRKWADTAKPDGDKFEKIITSDPTEVMINGLARDERLLQGFFLYIYAVLLLF